MRVSPINQHNWSSERYTVRGGGSPGGGGGAGWRSNLKRVKYSAFLKLITLGVGPSPSSGSGGGVKLLDGNVVVYKKKGEVTEGRSRRDEGIDWLIP